MNFLENEWVYSYNDDDDDGGRRRREKEKKKKFSAFVCFCD